MKYSIKIFFAFIIALFISNSALAQQTPKQAKTAAKEADIKNKVGSKNYTFVAQYALPVRGGQRYLTSEYNLRVTQDSVIAYLPFFGRVYMNPPLNPDEAGIKFTSTKFDYKIVGQKKGGWTIVITPHDTKFASKLLLDVFTNGTATLLVTSNTRDQINFNGYIKE